MGSQGLPSGSLVIQGKCFCSEFGGMDIAGLDLWWGGLLAGLHIQVGPLAGLHNHLWLSKVTDYGLRQGTDPGWTL